MGGTAAFHFGGRSSSLGAVPDGGDGGDGGSVILVADPEINTLLPFRYRTIFRADRGRHGEGAQRTGRSGDDLLVHVPVGTLVTEAGSDVVLGDLTHPEDRVVIARGGRGGRGNARFATSTNRAPRRHDPGAEGEQRQLQLELKLLADVGLVGFPNAGKSTFLSRVSAARPKIADYPFTTLAPSLGVAKVDDDRTLVIADIPGLIEGAHGGAGLGDRFLRHIERCRVILHLVDPTTHGRSFRQAVDTIDRELALYSPTLAEKPEILVLTKKDVIQDEGLLNDARADAERRGRPLYVVSAVTGEGLAALLRAAADAVTRVGPRIETGETAP